MKKTGLLNQPISTVIAGMGHLDTLVIADAGLPIPAGVMRIDLAVVPGIAGFIDVLKAVLQEFQVQEAVMACETKQHSPHILQAVQSILPDCPLREVPHSELKELTHQAVAVIRTGECTPYANIILVSGVIF